MATSFLKILAVSCGAISQVALTCVVGFIAAFLPRKDPLLTRPFVKRLATLSLILFEPALVFYVFTTRLSLAALGVFWILPLWQLLSSVVNFFYGKLLICVASKCGCLRNASDSQRLMRVIPIVCTFQNPVAFLLPVFASLCESGAPGTLPYQSLIAQDAQLACTTDTTLYSFLCLIPWSLLFWLWGYRKLVALKDAETQGHFLAASIETPAHDNTSLPHTAVTESDFSSIAPSNTADPEPIGASHTEGLRRRLSSVERNVEQVASNQQTEDSVPGPSFPQEWETWVDSQQPWAGGALVDWSLFPSISMSSYFDDSASLASTGTGIKADIETLSECKPTEIISNDGVGSSRKCCKRICANLFALLRVLLQPALAATFAGITAGLLESPGELLFLQSDSPLRPIGRTIYTLGQPAPLIGALIMSASLAGSFRDKQASDENEANEGANTLDNSPRKTSTFVMTLIPVFVRSILSPTTGLALVYLCLQLHSRADLLGRLASTLLPPGFPWLHLTIVLQWSSAPAQTIVVACARLGLDDIASSLARMYLPLYLMGIFSVTAASSFALKLLF